MLDFIGDIHAYADALKRLLSKMDYEEVNGVWQHSTRKVVFIGDYIDRGPAIRETLRIVRSMVENDKAIALMGNHEYNALAYNYRLPDGSYLRSHNSKHYKQHQATIDQFEEYPQEWKSYIEWFYSLPLFIDNPEFRAVHACWDSEQIKWLKEHGFYRMTIELLVSSHQKNSRAYTAINETLKGKNTTYLLNTHGPIKMATLGLKTGLNGGLIQ
jgi:predicted MPP superfamily phosphohydrolase